MSHFHSPSDQHLEPVNRAHILSTSAKNDRLNRKAHALLRGEKVQKVSSRDEKIQLYAENKAEIRQENKKQQIKNQKYRWFGA